MNLKVFGPNQTLVTVVARSQRIELFFSYNTPVAAYIEGKLYRTNTTDKEINTRTTNKHINSWLGGENYGEKPQEWFDRIANRITIDGEVRE